jgi:hypothetical protein
MTCETWDETCARVAADETDEKCWRITIDFHVCAPTYDHAISLMTKSFIKKGCVFGEDYVIVEVKELIEVK